LPWDTFGDRTAGRTGNVVLAGHRDSFFRGLRKIRLDDRIWIRAPGHHVEYRVDSTEVVGRETRVLAGTADDRLTLVTCYPFGFIGSAPKRFIVTASRILRPKAGPPPFTVSGNLEVGDDR
jgi:sortase A